MMHPRPSSASSARAKAKSLVINLASCKYDVLSEVAAQLQYAVHNDEEDTGWDLCWTDLSVSLERVSKLFCFQKLNHFPGMLEICRKAALARHIGRMATRCPRQYDFYPQSLLMPDQLDDLVGALKRNKKKIDSGTGEPTHWIVKPSAGAQGRGISLVQTAQQLKNCDISNSIAQQYVSRPLLLDGFKFDLRIYALVSSVDPLVIYMYDEGLARLATVPYEPPTVNNLNNNCMHLTNYAVNKRAPGFVSSDSVAPGHVASKRLASVVLQQVAQRAGTTKEALVQAIEGVVIKTVICIQPHLAHTYHTALTAGCQPGSSHSCCTTAGYCHGMLRTRSNGDPSSMTSDAHQTAGLRTSSIPPLACGCPPSQCFELLGFDILLDEELQPHLLEVNHSPSFSCDSKLDRDVKSALIYDVLAAQGQTVAGKQDWHAAQNQAQVERLYKLSRLPKHQPLRVPLHGRLGEVAAGLDEIAGETGAPRPVRCQRAASSRPSWTSGSSDLSSASNHSSQDRFISILPQHRTAHEIDGSVGFFSASDSRQRVGLLTRVFPPVDIDAQRTYAYLLAAAADAFPDQRCQCSYCKRRQRVQYVQSSAAHLLSAARAAPPLATQPVSGGRMFAVSASPRPMSRSMQRHVTNKLLEALEHEQLTTTTQTAAQAAVSAASKESDALRPEKPAVKSTATSRPGTAVGKHDSASCDAFMQQLASRAYFRSNSARVYRHTSDSAGPQQSYSSRTPSAGPALSTVVSEPCSDTKAAPSSSSILHSSAGEGAGTTTSKSSAGGNGQQGTEQPAGMPPKVPRVATLMASSTRRTRSRVQGSSNEVEAELLAMRMRTAAMLSNQFVSLCVSSTGSSSRMHTSRSGSARRVQGSQQAGATSTITRSTPTLIRAQSARL